MKIRRWGLLLTLMVVCFLLPQNVFAQEEARRLGSGCITQLENVRNVSGLFDDVLHEGNDYPDGCRITAESEEGIGSVYLIFDIEYGTYTVTDNDSGQVLTCGQQEFIHDFVDLEAGFGHAPRSVTLAFDSGTVPLNELFLFTPGQTPDYVQKWTRPIEDERADLVLFSTHSDDDQLFFAGVLPYYAGEMGYRVQVVYLTNHRNWNNIRFHEALDGLWNVGVTRYPGGGIFNDDYSKSLKEAYDIFARNDVSEDDLVGFAVEQLRRYKPLVALGHDLNGEYGHGQHRLFADILTKAVELTDDPDAYPASVEAYGIWRVPKLYLHLYDQNVIVMDWDQPLEAFGGLTAYQVTKYRGFPSHVSQYSDYEWYMDGAQKATEVKKYNPCYYGLYFSSCPEDDEKKDFFEHLVTYDEQIRLAEEEAERQRLKAEEEAAKAAEKAERAAVQAFREQEEARLLAERTRKEEQVKRILPIFWISGVVMLVSLGSFAAHLNRTKK